MINQTLKAAFWIAMICFVRNPPLSGQAQRNHDRANEVDSSSENTTAGTRRARPSSLFKMEKSSSKENTVLQTWSMGFRSSPRQSSTPALSPSNSRPSLFYCSNIRADYLSMMTSENTCRGCRISGRRSP